MPVTAAVALLGWAAGLAPAGGLTGPQRWTAAFFGARGVGSLYYLAYAGGKAPELGQGLWPTVAVTVVASVLVRGVLATPVRSRLDRAHHR